MGVGGEGVGLAEASEFGVAEYEIAFWLESPFHFESACDEALFVDHKGEDIVDFECDISGFPLECFECTACLFDSGC